MLEFVIELDEFDFIMNCGVLSNFRNVYIPNSNTIKYFQLFSSNKLSVLNNLCKFIKLFNDRVSPPG